MGLAGVFVGMGLLVLLYAIGMFFIAIAILFFVYQIEHKQKDILLYQI